jgi:hypothetical protein
MSRIGDLLRQGMATQLDGGKDAASEKVVAPPFRDTVFMHPSNMALLAYWRLTRGVRTLPAWAQIDLMEIGEHLKNLIMVEWPEGGAPLVRFAGPDIVRWTGMEPTGKNANNIFGKDICAAIPKETSRLRKVERLLLLQMKYKTEAGRRIQIEKLCLPLCDDKGKLRYLLIGCHLMNGSFAERNDKRPDTIIPSSVSIAQTTLLPPQAENCPAQPMNPAHRHPWVAQATSVA